MASPQPHATPEAGEAEPAPSDIPEYDGAPPASFSERFLAFLIDGALFYGLYLLTSKLAHSGAAASSGPHVFLWRALFGVLFLFYHAAAAASDTATLGKRVLGLRVADAHGGILSFPRALVRSLGYVLSSFFSAGFLWALFDSESRAWHDLIAGSKVVVVRKRPAVAVSAAAAIGMALLSGSFLWQSFGVPRLHDLRIIASGRKTLASLGMLEEVHLLRFGAYTDSVEKLVGLTADPAAFRAALDQSLDAAQGVAITLDPDGKGGTLAARARDSGRTPIAVVWPKK